MLRSDFIHTEMLAGDYIENIAEVKALLTQSKIEECLALLTELEAAMQITLAIGERYDLITIN